MHFIIERYLSHSRLWALKITSSVIMLMAPAFCFEFRGMPLPALLPQHYFLHFKYFSSILCNVGFHLVIITESFALNR